MSRQKDAVKVIIARTGNSVNHAFSTNNPLVAWGSKTLIAGTTFQNTGTQSNHTCRQTGPNLCQKSHIIHLFALFCITTGIVLWWTIPVPLHHGVAISLVTKYFSYSISSLTFLRSIHNIFLWSLPTGLLLCVLNSSFKNFSLCRHMKVVRWFRRYWKWTWISTHSSNHSTSCVSENIPSLL